MHSTAPVMMASPRQSTLRCLGKTGGERREHTEHGNCNGQALASCEWFDAEQCTDDHGLHRQCGERETGSGSRRIANGNVVEDEEMSEEADAELSPVSSISMWAFSISEMTNLASAIARRTKS